MKRTVSVLLLIVVSLLFFTACGKVDTAVEDTGEAKTGGNTTAEDVSLQEEADVEETATLLESAEPEKPERLNTAKFENLSVAAEQVGYSFRALIDFTSDEFHFSRFSISEPMEEINGMELAEPYPVIKLSYKKQSGDSLDITIFPYEGENIQSTHHNPICYVSTKEINGIDVSLSEYIMRMMPSGYEMTEEDWEFQDSGKGHLACDGVTEGDVYYRSMYWVQDGMYYHMDIWIPDAPVEDIEALAAEFINADLQ